MAQKDNFDWLAPVLGFVGLLAGSLFLSGQGKNNSSTNNSLPPPPVGQKPSGCGCNAKKE